MAAITRIALRALDRMGGPRIVLVAIPGGAKTVATAAGVSAGRVSQVLRQDPLPWEWAPRLAALVGCSESEIYEQLGQHVSGAVTSSWQDSRGPDGGAHGAADHA